MDGLIVRHQLTRQRNDRQQVSHLVSQPQTTIQQIIICFLVLAEQKAKAIGNPSVLDMVITHLESLPKLPPLSDPRDSECNSS